MPRHIFPFIPVVLPLSWVRGCPFSSVLFSNAISSEYLEGQKLADETFPLFDRICNKRVRMRTTERTFIPADRLFTDDFILAQLLFLLLEKIILSSSN